jgi:hypothetical protein
MSSNKTVRQRQLGWAVETAATFASPACWRRHAWRTCLRRFASQPPKGGFASVGAVSTAYPWLPQQIVNLNTL